MVKRIITHLPRLFLWLGIAVFIAYFASYTIIRFHNIYASYLDLGIMNQAVYNTYKSITTLDWSRFLEITNPTGPDQIKRMAVHNDIFLALLAPFYLIHPDAEVILVIQSLIIGVGAWFLFGIAMHALDKYRQKNLLALVMVLAYLLYAPLERAVIFEFHSVTLATTFLLAMVYFYLKRRYVWSVVFLVAGLLTKEQVGLTTAFFGAYALLYDPVAAAGFNIKKIFQLIKKSPANYRYAAIVIGISILWFIASVFIIIPFFRGSQHFALKYYDSDISSTFHNVFNLTSRRYLVSLLGPLGFISLLSPVQFLISLPELAINLVSSNINMRNIYYHYTAVITPWVFISGICSLRFILSRLKQSFVPVTLFLYIGFFTLFFAYLQGPLPFSKMADTYALFNKRSEQPDIDMWAARLKSDSLRVSTSSQIAPAFTSRRYYYIFSKYYYMADYIVLRLPEVYNYPEKDELIPVYEELIKDTRFTKIFDHNGVVVYKKV